MSHHFRGVKLNLPGTIVSKTLSDPGLPRASSSSSINVKPEGQVNGFRLNAFLKGTVLDKPPSSGSGLGITSLFSPFDSIYFGFKNKTKFTPEYEYRHFYIHGESHPEWAKEHGAIALQILSAGRDVKVSIFVNDASQISATQTSFLQAYSELAPYLKSGSLKFLPGQQGESIWAQDTGESTGGAGSQFIMGAQDLKKYAPKYQFAYPMRSAHRLADVQVPIKNLPDIWFEGGNLTKARINDRKLLIVGETDIKVTAEYLQGKYNYDSLTSLVAAKRSFEVTMRDVFGADHVLIFKNQSPLMFHVDQSVFFPRDGTAILLRPDSSDGIPDDLKNAYKALQDFGEQLRSVGFQVIEIPTTAEHIRKYQSYANAIPIHAAGKSKIIMPSFEDVALEKRIKLILEEKGFEVSFVKNTTYKLRGNSHCMTGALE